MKFNLWIFVKTENVILPWEWARIIVCIEYSPKLVFFICCKPENVERFCHDMSRLRLFYIFIQVQQILVTFNLQRKILCNLNSSFDLHCKFVLIFVFFCKISLGTVHVYRTCLYQWIQRHIFAITRLIERDRVFLLIYWVVLTPAKGKLYLQICCAILQASRPLSWTQTGRTNK